ncbi:MULTISPECIES: glycosyltransferase family 2 protein [unclassified Roseibium]|uniref:glycosyltransferase family 2 protein n=1 Tax=unclassified Roseibium TaxID=2629323 RepID=UPI00273EF33D|nr:MULTISPECIES: glycosyltransferase family 2 protein [unclassified Roseibium]
MGGEIVTVSLQSAAPFFAVDETSLCAVCEIETDPKLLVQSVLANLNVFYTAYSQAGRPPFLIVRFPRHAFSQAHNRAVLRPRDPDQPILVIDNTEFTGEIGLAHSERFADLDKIEILARLFCRPAETLFDYVSSQATSILADEYKVFDGVSFFEVPLRTPLEPFSVSKSTGELRPLRHDGGKSTEREATWFFCNALPDTEDLILIGDGAFYIVRRTQAADSYAQRSVKLPAAAALAQREKLGAFLHRSNKDTEQFSRFVALQKMQNVSAQTYSWREEVSAVVDTLVGLNDAIFLGGEFKDPTGLVETITVRTAFGETLALDQFMVRPKNAKDRFCALIPVKRGGRNNVQIRGQVTLASGSLAAIASPFWTGDLNAARTRILSALPSASLTEDVLEKVVGPALKKAYDTYYERPIAEEVTPFGPVLSAPDCTLIIPLYKEYGFIKPQLQSFHFDPEFKNTEVVYVLDRPEDASAVEHLIKGLARIYKVSVRLVVNAKNAGFAGASNLGASAAASDLLLFFNSDVVPGQSPWLSNWITRHRSTVLVGASGPRLLYADGSLQHAGLYSEKDLMPWYTNHHYFKGYPGDYPMALESRPVPGVTGACLMMEKDLFEDLGGFGDEFVVGDFEDSDLCLKAIEAGRSNYYFGDISLYHFERASMNQSQAYTKSGAVRYNGWLYSEKWKDALDSIAQPEAV